MLAHPSDHSVTRIFIGISASSLKSEEEMAYGWLYLR